MCLCYREVSSVKGELVPYLVNHQSIRAKETYTKPLKQGELFNVLQLLIYISSLPCSSCEGCFFLCG